MKKVILDATTKFSEENGFDKYADVRYSAREEDYVGVFALIDKEDGSCLAELKCNLNEPADVLRYSEYQSYPGVYEYLMAAAEKKFGYLPSDDRSKYNETVSIKKGGKIVVVEGDILSNYVKLGYVENDEVIHEAEVSRYDEFTINVITAVDASKVEKSAEITAMFRKVVEQLYCGVGNLSYNERTENIEVKP